MPPSPSHPQEVLGPLLTDARRMKREAVKRRKVVDEKAFGPEDVEGAISDGWRVQKNGRKKKAKLARDKPGDERLENKFWYLLFKLQYPEMNEGRKFTILIERKGAEPLRKQVDVFAKDDETVIVAECKSSKEIGRRSLQKDIEEFANLKGPISTAIKKHYGRLFTPKIIWLFVTENIVWSQPDRERAAGENIRIITDRELRYYIQIAEHLGKAARFQFLGEFLKDQQIPGLANRQVQSIRGKLGGRKFYCFVSTPRSLLKICFVNHRSLNDPDGAPTYQRLISRTRLREIADFIKKGGFFPNNIIVNFTKPVRFDKVANDNETNVVFGTLTLPDKYRSAWVIDGQHRLYGYAPLDDRFLDQNIVVLAFEQMEKVDEANIFVTINHEQRSVPKHLLDDLEGELKWGSAIPNERIGAIAARLINVMNSDVGGPFYSRITQQGLRSTNKACLTIPAIKDALRRFGLLGRTVLKNTYVPGPLCGDNDSATLDRAQRALTRYLEIIRRANMGQWELGREGETCTNVGIQAYVQLLASLIKYWEGNTASDPIQMEPEELIGEIEEFMSPIVEFLESADEKMIESEFSSVPFGSGGPRAYYFVLCKRVKSKIADFEPDGLADWEAEQSQETIEAATKQIRDLEIEMKNTLFGGFKVRYGEENNAYWERGVPMKEVKTKAYDRSQEAEFDERLSLETYVDLIDLKKIVEHKQNWEFFKPVFNIPDPGEKGLAKNLKWIDRLNELRRISAHPSDKRHYKADDLEYVQFIHDEFFKRLESWDPVEADQSNAPS